MTDAQVEMRRAFLGGFAEQLVSGLIGCGLSFITLYGMNMFGVLASLLVLGGTGLALYGPPIFSLGGWLTGAILIVFAFVARFRVLQEERSIKDEIEA